MEEDFFIGRKGEYRRIGTERIHVPQQNPPTAITLGRTDWHGTKPRPNAVFARDTAPTNLSSKILLSPKKSNFIRNQKMISPPY